MDDKSKNPGIRYQVDLPSLEADIAFFNARIALVGEKPNTLNQKAQVKAFSALEGHMGGMMRALKRNQKK